MWHDDGTVNWHAVIGRLTHWVRHRVSDPTATDDLVQDILERLVMHGERLLLVGNPLGWMHRIAANAIIDHYRRPRRHDVVPEELPAEPPDALGASRDELAGCIRPLVMQLDPLSREALLATDLGGMSQVEAAQAAGIAVSTMKSRIQRGRQKLRDAVLQCCHVELDRRSGVIDVTPRPAGGQSTAPCCGDVPPASPRRSPGAAAGEPHLQRRDTACRCGEAEG
jgi:RNA polymerase sigma-70 factor (ECF subfamily)